MTLSRTDTILRDIRNATLCFEAGIDKLKGIECLALAYDLIAEIDNNNSDAQVLSFCENLRCTHTRLVLDKVFPYLHSQTYPSIQYVAFWYEAAVILDEGSPVDNSVGEIKQSLERLADDELSRRSEVVAVSWVNDCSLLNGFIRSQTLSREQLDEAEKKYKYCDFTHSRHWRN